MRFLRLLLVFLLLLLAPGEVFAKSLSDIQVEIERYEKELGRLSAQAKTLSNQISQFDAQINLATLKISETEEKISLLGGRIDQLEGSLNSLTNAFSTRAVETYKMARLGNQFLLLVLAKDVNQAVSRFHYLQKIQEEDRSLLERLQTAQTIYIREKEDQVDLQNELENQKVNLTIQKKEKANLLAVTRNNEKRYQELLAAARAELAVVLGQGKETFMRNVSEGETIGRIIPAASGCSSGQHLHFEVHQGDSIQDPNNFLRSISFTYDYGPDQYGYYGTVNPHGSWNWPMNEPIQINQGFGSHSFAKTFYPGGVHNGIDIDSGSSSTVKAVKAGKLYGGSYQCGGRYPGALLYAKVEHDGGLTTWYLHTTPQ